MATTDEQSLDKKSLLAVYGNSGTQMYSGYISEEPNSQWRDHNRTTLVEEMRRGDGAVKAVLNAIKAPLLSAEWYLDYEKDDELISEFAELCEKSLFGLPNRNWDELLREVLTYLDFGHSVFELVFYIDENGNVCLLDLEPRIQTSIMKWKTSDGKAGITQIKRNDLPVENSTDSIGFSYSIPKDKLVIFTNDKEGDDVTGQSILRSAYIHYYNKSSIYRIAAIGVERNSVGIPVVWLPEGSGSEEKEAVEKVLKNLRANEKGYIVFPKPKKDGGYEFQIMTAGSNPQGSTIKDLIDHHNRMILMSVLAEFLDLGGGGSSGSYSLSEDQSSFFLKCVEEKASYVSEQIGRDIIRKLAKYNPKFSNIPQCDLPKLRFSRLGTIDYTEMATVVTQLTTAGYISPDDEDVQVYLRKIFNLPELSEDQLMANKEKQIDNELNSMGQADTTSGDGQQEVDAMFPDVPEDQTL